MMIEFSSTARRKLASIGIALLLFGGLITTSGCMTHPYHGQHIGAKANNVAFSGWTQTPNETVTVQTLLWFGWANFTNATSSNTPVEYDGESWYYWSVSRKLPRASWTADIPGRLKAYVRSKDSSGNLLFTFEEEFDDWFDGVTPIVDLYGEHGHGNTITIYADDDD